MTITRKRNNFGSIGFILHHKIKTKQLGNVSFFFTSEASKQSRLYLTLTRGVLDN
jgi:hypothetical protein